MLVVAPLFYLIKLFYCLDIGAALEISFRNEARLFSLQKEKEFLSMLSLLRFSIQFAKLAHELSPNVGKIPFLLISDVLERETIAVAERVWSTVEELADDLTAPALFSKGKIANSEQSSCMKSRFNVALFAMRRQDDCAAVLQRAAETPVQVLQHGGTVRTVRPTVQSCVADAFLLVPF